jgi:hypothetical protein
MPVYIRERPVLLRLFFGCFFHVLFMSFIKMSAACNNSLRIIAFSCAVYFMLWPFSQLL